MAININTLHIGAHVEYEGKRARIEQISSLHFPEESCGVFIWQNKIPECVSVDRINPIPITPELLTELEFEDWSYMFVGRDKRYGRKIKNKEIVFSPIVDDCWKVGVLFGGFDVGYCLCRYLHEAEAFLALHNVELIND